MNVIIPIRNRPLDILKWLPKSLPNNHRIFVIEQVPGKPFNKGTLVNIGFLEALKRDPNSFYFVANDADTFPLDPNVIDYSPKEGVRHPYGHKFALGGIVFFDKDSYIRMNGFSNKYWGWGSEDKDLQFRANAKGILIDRSNFIERRSHPQIHDPQSRSSNKQIHEESDKRYNNLTQLYNQDVSDIQNDGLNTTDYQVVKGKQLNDNIFHITVKI